MEINPSKYTNVYIVANLSESAIFLPAAETGSKRAIQGKLFDPITAEAGTSKNIRDAEVEGGGIYKTATVISVNNLISQIINSMWRQMRAIKELIRITSAAKVAFSASSLTAREARR